MICVYLMHPLYGPIKKIDRAQEQLHALRLEVDAFIEAHRYGVVAAERDPKTGRYALRITTTGDPDPPLRWGVYIGEIAHNLRSALDQIACQLALDGHAPAAALFEKTSFPIYLFGPLSTSSDKKRRWTDDKRCLTIISKKHRAVLQRFQPYSRWDWDRPKGIGIVPPMSSGRLSPLWLLHEINNADKHRLLQVTAKVISGLSMIIRPPGPPNLRVSDIRLRFGGRLVDGAKIGTIASSHSFEDVDVYFGVQPQIVFWDGCDAAKGLPVIRALEGMMYQVHRIVVLLAAQFRPLEPPWGPPD